MPTFEFPTYVGFIKYPHLQHNTSYRSNFRANHNIANYHHIDPLNPDEPDIDPPVVSCIV